MLLNTLVDKSERLAAAVPVERPLLFQTVGSKSSETHAAIQRIAHSLAEVLRSILDGAQAD